MTKSLYENIDNAIYDPYHSKYHDTASLSKELERTFDLCNGCRMCFKYCPSFPSLFEAMDRNDANANLLTEEDKVKIIGECFQCKICYVVCPYTEKEQHPFKIDFPSLILRAKIVRNKKQGIREKLLGNPDLLASLTKGWLKKIANASIQNNFHRQLLHKVLGIHKKKLLPLFSNTSFQNWFKKTKKERLQNLSINHSQAPRHKVVLFSTCYVNYNNLQLGKDTVEVLEKNNILIAHPTQSCCGMPALDNGNLKVMLKKMNKNIKSLYPFVKEGYKILAINPTCSLTLKEEYKKFAPPGEKRFQAEEVSRATMDLNEFLFELKKTNEFYTSFKSTPEKVAYHVPCHLRAQNIGFRSRDIMKLIPNANITPVAECCGHNGTWAMKKEYFEASLQVGTRAFNQLEEKSANHIVTDCPLAAVQLQQGMGLKERPLHPIQILAKAYKESEDGGFSEIKNKDEGKKN